MDPRKLERFADQPWLATRQKYCSPAERYRELQTLIRSRNRGIPGEKYREHGSRIIRPEPGLVLAHELISDGVTKRTNTVSAIPSYVF